METNKTTKSDIFRIDPRNIVVQEGFRDRLPARFELVAEEKQGEMLDLTVKLTDGATANELLSSVLPMANIQAFNEILPSMNDIFIQAVEQA